MGTISFLLPDGLPEDMTADLERACLAGGFDHSPSPTQVQLRGNRLTLQRTVDESGFLIVPWPVNGAGRLTATTATLMERQDPYSAPIELARGKLNQIRNHFAECTAMGMSFDRSESEALGELGRRFGRAVAQHPSEKADELAQEVLVGCHALIDKIMPRYAQQLFEFRHQRLPKLETALGSQLSHLPPEPDILTAAFNSLRLSMGWREVEPIEARYSWDACDAVLDWADAHSMPMHAGPLIDFSPNGLPDWLSTWKGDLSNIANFMCDFVETAIARYRKRIDHWFLVNACNVSGVLGLNEDDMLWLTARLAESALQMAPELSISFGVIQPWAEYMAREEHTYTPLVFLDTLLRTGLKMKALNVEVVMGVSERGSYCRDLLEFSRLLDSFAVLSTPLQVTLAIPSRNGKDAMCLPGASIEGGAWHQGYTPLVQAEWAAEFAGLALSKPYVNGVFWAQLSDSVSHWYPHCGLLDSVDRPKPALTALRHLRQTHLR